MRAFTIKPRLNKDYILKCRNRLHFLDHFSQFHLKNSFQPIEQKVHLEYKQYWLFHSKNPSFTSTPIQPLLTSKLLININKSFNILLGSPIIPITQNRKHKLIFTHRKRCFFLKFRRSFLLIPLPLGNHGQFFNKISILQA
jgi:hypothetical protein